MKNVVVIMDGAAGWALPEYNNLTCLELAHTPNLDTMAKAGRLGLARTVPRGMEPSSACACMSVMGYDPEVYYRGRSAIEAKSMGIPVANNEVVFRCNLVTVQNGKMLSYSAGHISTAEAKTLIESLQEKLGNNEINFYSGINYRHILKIRGHEETLNAACTAPHDIPNRQVADFLPGGQGSKLLRDIIKSSEEILCGHPVNIARTKRGELPATAIWLFWGSGQIPEMPPFQKKFGVKAAMTSGVDLLRGLGIMANIDILEIPGVTDGLDNDFAGQAKGSLQALQQHDLIFIHVEAPDEAGHAGNVREKIEAIEKIDREIIGRLCHQNINLMVMPDHPTPIKTQTHNDEPVPFLLWGQGFAPNGAQQFSEKEAKYGGILIDNGFELMDYFLHKDK